MNKNEILKKCRNQKNDEGLENAGNVGRKFGVIAFCCVFIFLRIFNLVMGKDSYSISSLFWIFLAVESYPKYRFTKNKSYLVTFIAGLVAGICSLLTYIIVTLR